MHSSFTWRSWKNTGLAEKLLRLKRIKAEMLFCIMCLVDLTQRIIMKIESNVLMRSMSGQVQKVL